MNMRTGTLAMVAAIVAVGFAIGGWLAYATRPSGHTTSTTIAATVRTPEPVRTTVPIAAATPPPAHTPPITPALKPVATPVPTLKPAPASTATAVPSTTAVATTATTATSAATPAVAVRNATTGTWLLDEANTQVGTIVWAVNVTATPGAPVLLEAHKQSVGGRPAVPCERQTTVHAEFPSGTALSVPYREVNCEGVATVGEMRVSSIPGSSTSFSGSFWRNGVKLGDFSARRR